MDLGIPESMGAGIGSHRGFFAVGHNGGREHFGQHSTGRKVGERQWLGVQEGQLLMKAVSVDAVQVMKIRLRVKMMCGVCWMEKRLWLQHRQFSFACVAASQIAKIRTTGSTSSFY